MKLKQIKCQHFARAKTVFVFPSYIVACTGQKAVLLDRQYNLIHAFENLDYVYSADISPDESKLLLVSNGNKFYIADLSTFEVKRHTVRAPMNYNIQGCGCWSFDSQFVYICVASSNSTICSTLRRFNASDLTDYTDFIPGKYLFQHILRLEENKNYFLMGANRQDGSRHYFIYFDGSTSLEIPLEEDALGCYLQFDEKNGVVTIAATDACRQYTKLGKLIRKFEHPAPVQKNRTFSDVFTPLFAGNEEFEEKVHDITAAFGLDRIAFKDDIKQYTVSSCGKYLYMASASGFYVLNKDGNKVLASVSEKFGATNFTELEPGLIAVANMSTVKLYKICE